MNKKEQSQIEEIQVAYRSLVPFFKEDYIIKQISSVWIMPEREVRELLFAPIIMNKLD